MYGRVCRCDHGLRDVYHGTCLWEVSEAALPQHWVYVNKGMNFDWGSETLSTMIEAHLPVILTKEALRAV